VESLKREVGLLKREVELQKTRANEVELLKREVELQKIERAREIEALKRELDTLRLIPASVQEAVQLSVQEAVQLSLKEERESLARQASQAKFLKDQRTIWLRSPECVLEILAFVAMNGYCAKNFSSLSRAFRGDSYMWAAIKDRCGTGGQTCLMFHADRGDLARVEWLIKRAANVNAATRKNGMTPLMYASKNGHLKIVKELCKNGANVNAARTGDGFTSLMIASQNGRLEVVRLLLERGANNNLQCTSGSTALSYAATPAMKLLLK
jgi:hypothetical protein